MNVCDLFELVLKSLPELFKLAYLIIERGNRSRNRAKTAKTKNKRRPRVRG